MVNRLVGLHIRFYEDLFAVAFKAMRLNLPIFQCFLVDQVTGRLIDFTAKQIRQFITLREKHFQHLYAHISYQANLCMPGGKGLRILQREMTLAKKLAFTHVVVHPGSAKQCTTKEEGIDNLVRTLNTILASELDLIIVLENTAHGNWAVGSDFTDFVTIRQKLDYPEKVMFCVDTAHAYCYGYPIVEEDEQKKFMALLETTLGLYAIALIHLNDTQQPCGLKIDQHALLGKGNIGVTALKRFVMQECLRTIPLIMELPTIDEDEEKKVYDQVLQWHQV
jgi:deoxyribonuclease-4